MKTLQDNMRGLARILRVKRAAEKATPGPIPNPTASRAQGDLGSLDEPKTKNTLPNPMASLRRTSSLSTPMV